MAANKYAFIATGSSVQVSTQPGTLVSVIAGAMGSDPVTLYDTNNGTTTGTEIATLQYPGSSASENPVAIPFDVALTSGLYVVVPSATGPGVTVTYS